MIYDKNNFAFLVIFLTILLINSLIMSNIQLMVLIFFSVLYIIYFLSKTKRIHFEYNIYLVIFFLWIIVRIPFADSHINTLIIDFLVYVLFFLLQFVILKNKLIIEKGLKLIVLYGFINFVLVLVQFFMPVNFLEIVYLLTPETSHSFMREMLLFDTYIGLTNQPAHLAGVFLVSFIILLLNKSIFKYKILRNIFIGLFLIGLVFAAKRAHMLFGLISISLIYIYMLSVMTYSKNIYLKINVLLVMLLSLVSIIYFNYEKIKIFSEFSSTVKGILGGEDVSNGRSILYDFTIETFWDNPILGNGWRYVFENSIGLISEMSSHPHNIYLQVLNEYGIIGLILLLLLLIVNLWRSITLVKVTLVKVDKMVICTSLFYQIFFILYGFTGNVLTDYNYLLLYSVFVMFSNSYRFEISLGEK